MKESSAGTTQHQRGQRVRLLKTLELFAGLSEEEVSEIGSLGHDVSYLEGNDVFRVGEPNQGFYLLKTGRVEVYRLGSEGQRVTMAFHEAGAAFGFSSTQGVHCCFARAIEDSYVCTFSWEAFEQIGTRWPMVTFRMCRILVAQLSDMDGRIAMATLGSLRTRLAHQLVLLQSENGCVQGLTHEDLSYLVGGARQTVSQTLEQFERAGLVKLHRKKIDVLDSGGLMELTTSVQPPIHRLAGRMPF